MDANSDIENMPSPHIVADVHAGNAMLRERQIWSFVRLEDLLKRFSPAERLALYGFSILLAVSVIVLLIGLNAAISTEVPTRGGTFTEGETAPARFINPVLAISQSDQDLTQLLYSGLMRALPDGTYTSDLAQEFSI